MIRVWVEAFPSTAGGRSVSAVIHAGPFEAEGQALRELLGPAWIAGERVCVMGKEEIAATLLENEVLKARTSEAEQRARDCGALGRALDQVKETGSWPERLALVNLLRRAGLGLLADLLAVP